MNNQQSTISDFLSRKKMAIIGVSRNPKDFSRMLMQAFVARGFEVAPINPATDEIDGSRCHPDLQSVTDGVEWALIMTGKPSWPDQLRRCIDAGVKRVWFYGVTGSKEVPADLLEACRREGIDVVAGQCPFMFLPETPFYHRIHGFVWKVIGLYPK